MGSGTPYRDTPASIWARVRQSVGSAVCPKATKTSSSTLSLTDGAVARSSSTRQSGLGWYQSDARIISNAKGGALGGPRHRRFVRSAPCPRGSGTVGRVVGRQEAPWLGRM